MPAELISIELLNHARQGLDVMQLLRELTVYPRGSLQSELSDDDRKLAFWINLFNAGAIISLKQNKRILHTLQGRAKFFGGKKIIITGKALSLNDILHGILRRSKFRTGKGYLQNPFPGKFIKNFMPEALDPAIHFGINYGSVSCPEIRVFKSEEIRQQFELSAISFLDATTFYYPDEHIVTVSQIFNWYIADFGGKNGILRLLQKYNKIPFGTRPMIIYTPFKWEPLPGL